MEITTLYYIIIVIVSVFVFYLIKDKYRLGFLILLSCAFIATYSPRLLLYVLIYAAFNFFIAKEISTSTYGRTFYRIGIFVNLTQLILLRYASFAIDPFFRLLNCETRIAVLSDFIIPIGISYFTLQGIGYLINVRMKWEKPEGNFPDFFLYIIFAPKFISGPIERSNHFLTQLKNARVFDSKNVSTGLRIALVGFFKKVVIANHLGTAVTAFYSNPDLFGGAYVWLLIILQPLYLYFDFSGYTDIAIGVSKMFGIDLLPNFNRPFLSGNVSTFWKRFHISLASWFNDYVFKQTSFKLRKWRQGSTIISLLLTWGLFGIWHGAGWNFMFLGLLQALAIIYEFYTKRARMKFFSCWPGGLRLHFARLVTFLFYGFSLTFFFSPDMETTKLLVSSLFQPMNTMHGELRAGPILFGLAFAGIMMAGEIVKEDYNNIFYKVELIWSRHKLLRLSVYYILGFLILSQLGGTSVFVYQMF